MLASIRSNIRRAKSGRNHRRPLIESLEKREMLCFDGNASYVAMDFKLVYTGTSGNDTAILSYEVDGIYSYVTINNGSQTCNVEIANDERLRADLVYSIQMTGGSGNDNLDLTGVTTSSGQGYTQNPAAALTGDGGNDTLRGAGGSDNISGGAGNDVIAGNRANDTLAGGDDIDTLDYSTSTYGANISLDGVANDYDGTHQLGGELDAISDFENVTGGSGDDVITGSASANTLSGGDGNDTIYGGDGNDNLYGEAGNDTLKPEGGSNDYFSGGTGSDTADYSDTTTANGINLSEGTAVLGNDVDSLDEIENVIGGSGNDDIIGTEVANVFKGGGGDDTINGYGGDDTIEGGDGADLLEGGNGNDSMLGGAGNDTIYGNAGNDTIKGDGGNDILNGNDGDDRFYVADGAADTVNGGNDNDALLDTADGSDVLNL